MKQQHWGLNLSTRRTLKATFLQEMNAVACGPNYWRSLPRTYRELPPSARPLRLCPYCAFVSCSSGSFCRGHREALLDVPLYRQFAGLGNHERVPDQVSILHFHHLLEQHELAEQVLVTVNAVLYAKGLLLKEGTAVDTTPIAAPSSTKNKGGKRDREIHQTKKGNQRHFDMKADIGIDTGAVHTEVGTAPTANDVTQAHALVHGQETDIFADAGNQSVAVLKDTQHIAKRWHVTMRPSKRRALEKSTPIGGLVDELESVKARIRAKVERPFRIVKHQFGYRKVRYRGFKKNTAQLSTSFAMANLCGC